MRKKWLVAGYTTANLLFMLVVADQWIELRELPGVVSQYASSQKSGHPGIDKYMVQCLFYALGAGLSLAVLAGLFRKRGVNKVLLIAYGTYFLVFVTLELPLYNEHYGWAEPHRHSFWYGPHFH